MPIPLAFLFGLIIGSFLNVLIARLHTGRSLSGRSSCMVCGRELAPRDLVPLLSYASLRGRCRFCKSRIPLRYPLVELATGALFAALAAKGLPAASFLVLAAAGSALIVVFVYDLRHKIVPDEAVAFLIVLAFLNFLLSRPGILELAAGPLMALPIAAFAALSKGRVMGWGDAKLALPLGWLLGFWGAIGALLLSFWIGGATAIILLLLGKTARGRALFEGGKPLTMKSEVPFAPFLVLGAAATFFLGFNAADLFFPSF